MRDSRRLLGGDGAHSGGRSKRKPLLTSHSASLGGAVAGVLLGVLLSGGGMLLVWSDDDSLWTITLFCVTLVGWMLIMSVLLAHFIELRGQQHTKGKVKTLFFLFNASLGLWFVVVLGCLLIFIPMGLATISNSNHTWGWGLLGAQIISLALQFWHWYSYDKYYKDLELKGDITSAPNSEMASLKSDKTSRRRPSFRRSKKKSFKRSSAPPDPPLDSFNHTQHPRSPSPPSPAISAISYNSTGGALLREPSTRTALHVVNASPTDSAPSDDDVKYHDVPPPSTYSPFSHSQHAADRSVSDDDTFHLPRNNTTTSAEEPYDPNVSYDSHDYHSHHPAPLTPGRRPDQPNWRPPRPSPSSTKPPASSVWKPTAPIYLQKPHSINSLPSQQPKSLYQAYDPNNPTAGAPPPPPLNVPRASTPAASRTYVSDWRPSGPSSPRQTSPYYPSSTPGPSHRKALASSPAPRGTPLLPGQRELPSFAGARRDPATSEVRSVSPDSLPPMPEYHPGDQYTNVHSLGRRRLSRSHK